VKNFDEWNVLKKKVNKKLRLDIKTGSIWLCNLGLNIGYETDGKNKDYIRPVVVILGFKRGGGIVLPLTTTKKKNRFIIHVKGKSKVNITQVRYLDSRRFYREVDKLNPTNLKRIIREFTNLFNK
jgi:mRNA-degrading endonuclease toxin of MazEF toxin-antitoxin module